MRPVPELRITAINSRSPRSDGRWVLYWMNAFRRTRYNFALDRAVQLAAEFNRPLVVVETLDCDHRWANWRRHQFVVQGMADNAARLEHTTALYYPFVERQAGQTRRLIARLSESACAVVSDDFPCDHLPGVATDVANRMDVAMEAVDSNGLLPLRAADRVFPTAHAFRRFLQRGLRPHLSQLPKSKPFAGCRLPQLDGLPAKVREEFPPFRLAPTGEATIPEGLPIGCDVEPAPVRGGADEAGKVLQRFLDHRLDRYQDDRNNPDPEREAASGLSPYLHHGHVSAHEVFQEIAACEDWSPQRLGKQVHGSREGWWGMSPQAEGFLDELVTWRELGYNMTWQEPRYDRFGTLPEWARSTLRKHARDRREQVYELEGFEAADTHDPLWNAAQRQLAREGRVHNYLRMLWGKKILEWSALPEDALEVMIELNNKYALDGCNPNSYSGIFWVLGRYDRAWGPERPVFGTIRYMSSENTARKLPVKRYLEKYRPVEVTG